LLHDPEAFSNVVSRRTSVPNGMDPPEHTRFRRLIEPYFSETEVARFEPVCRSIVESLLEELGASGDVEVMDALARPFAATAQCAFLGWPRELAPALVEWTLNNQQATLEQDRRELARLAGEFQAYVTRALEARRSGDEAGSDTTSRLMRETVYGRRLRDDEIASILRNWTVGEIGTLSASVGILVQAIARHAALQDRLRREPALRPNAIEEILRWHGPLVDNRRVATRNVTLNGRAIEPGDRVTINWIAANRDPEVFSDPAAIDPERDQAQSLLWGAGLHVCPGARLARMELRVVLDAILEATEHLALVPDAPPRPARYPASGFGSVCVRIRSRIASAARA
jgi:cytochrome P450